MLRRGWIQKPSLLRREKAEFNAVLWACSAKIYIGLESNVAKGMHQRCSEAPMAAAAPYAPSWDPRSLLHRYYKEVQ